MHIPVASTIALVMEFFIAGIIAFVLYGGYFKNKFPEKLALFAVIYEIIFNVGYMLYRTLAHTKTYELSPGLKLIAILHGALSLVMLVAIIALFPVTRKNYRSGKNYLRGKKAATLIFSFSWITSLFSGVFLYFKVYF